jgi:hypothetical protein
MDLLDKMKLVSAHRSIRHSLSCEKEWVRVRDRVKITVRGQVSAGARGLGCSIMFVEMRVGVRLSSGLGLGLGFTNPNLNGAYMFCHYRPSLVNSCKFLPS